LLTVAFACQERQTRSSSALLLNRLLLLLVTMSLTDDRVSDQPQLREHFVLATDDLADGSLDLWVRGRADAAHPGARLGR
jgi:hypothetical protein